MATEQKDIIDRVHSARQSVSKTFRTKYDKMAENSQFLRLIQHSDNQLKRMSEQNRVPYVLDYLTSSINTYLGIQRDKRTSIFYYPVEKGDEIKCEVLNAVKEAKLNENNFVYVESDIFKDGLVEKVGATGYEWSREKNKNGTLKIFRIPPRELMWDLNSRDFGREDATWISRGRLMTKRDLINRHPDKKDLIENMDIWDDYTSGVSLDMEYNQMIASRELGSIILCEFYEREWEKRWFIRNNDEQSIAPLYYRSKREAEKQVREDVQKHEARETDLQSYGQEVGYGYRAKPAPNFQVFDDTTPVICKTEIADTEVFSNEVIDEPFYPIDMYHPYEHDGDWWCPLDVLKDGQRFYNKMFTMTDHWIGTMAKGALFINDNVPEDVAKKAEKMFSSTGGTMRFPDPDVNLKLVESKGPAPQLFTMMDLARQNLEDNSGGRNFQGKKETASESGVAVRTRIEQGGLAGFIVYDNLRRWKMSAGTKIAWYLTTYMTAPQVVRIQGEQYVQELMEKFQEQNDEKWFEKAELSPGVGFMKVNTNSFNTLENLKVDIAVDEAKWSISKNQSTLQEINMAMQSNPLLAKTFPPEVVLEYMGLPFSVKEQARIRMKQLEEQAIQMEQQKMQNPPNLSASLSDIESLPPEGQVQLAAQFGIQLALNAISDPSEKEAMLNAMKAMTDMQSKKQKHELDMEIARAKAGQEMEISTAKAGQDMMTKGMKAEQDMEISQAKSLNGDRE
jgi:hypothetical protein